MSQRDDFVARVAAGNSLHPQSAICRIWSPAGRSDVYASVRNIAGQIKISLHETGACHAGLTTQFAEKEVAAVAAMGGSRNQSKWFRRTHADSCIVTPLQFVIPASELWPSGEFSNETEKITWIEPPNQGRSLIISCIFSGQILPNNEWPGRIKGTHLIGTKLLPNGEKFWLIWQDCPTSQIERNILLEARAHVLAQKRVSFSEINEKEHGPRYLIFKEYFHDGLLVVLDAAAQSIRKCPN
jgi:hypothetical protein